MADYKKVFWIFSALVVLLFSFSASADQGESSRYLQREDGSVIEYQTFFPSGDSFPLIVALQGSDCAPALRSGMGAIAPLLQSLGFGFLIVEKPGIHHGNADSRCPAEYFERNTVDQRVRDLQTVISSLRRDLNFQRHWNGSLMWEGGSEGGTVASLAAPLFSETTATILLGSGGGMTMADELKLLTTKELRRQSKSELEISEAVNKLEMQFQEMRANPTSDRNWWGETNTYKWWASILDLDVKGSLAKLKSPVYIAHGTEDKSVPVESADQLVKDKNTTAFEQWTYVRYDGLDHHFVNAHGESKRDLVLNSALLYALVREDQRLRIAFLDLLNLSPNDPRLVELGQKLHERDQIDLGFIKWLFAKGAFPLISTSGLAANRNAWLLVQHADEDPSFQRQVLTFLEQAYSRKDTYGPDVAYLKDRVAVNEAHSAGREPLQIFGTQGRMTQGCWQPWPIEDRENVDKRRSEYGLNALAEYVRLINELVGGVGCRR